MHFTVQFGAFNAFWMVPMFGKQTALLGEKPDEAKKELNQRTLALLEDLLVNEQFLKNNP